MLPGKEQKSSYVYFKIFDNFLTQYDQYIDNLPNSTITWNLNLND